MRNLAPTTMCALACALLGPAPASAAGAGAPPAALKPLRTLVYSVQLSSHTINREQTSGINAQGVATPYGSGAQERDAAGAESGTVTVDVVAATADGGLVADASYRGNAFTQPPVRVAIMKDGRLSFAPGTPLAPEVARLLPLLARGLIAERDVSPGSAWTVPAPPPLRGSATYRVTAINGDVATMAIENDLSVPGPQGYDEHGSGTAVYDTAKLCPRSFDYESTARHHPTMDQYVVDTSHVTAKLVSDTLAANP